MRGEYRYHVSIVAALIVLTLLVWMTIVTPPALADLLPTFFFSLLIIFTTTFGVPLAGGSVSLLPMTAVATYLALGLVPAGWAALVGMLAFGVIRYRWAEWLGMSKVESLISLVGVTAANITLHTGSILASGAVYQLLGGVTPLVRVASVSQLLQLVLLGLTYLGTNYLIAGVYIAARGRAPFRSFLRFLPGMMAYEGGPLVFAPLMALIYTWLGVEQFVLFALVLVLSSLATRSLAITSRRLERRVRELDSLQAVGQALSASLDVETVVSAIYEQVARLMPAHDFYVALYDPALDEVSFPLAVEDGEHVQWRSRRTGNGLTEHVLRMHKPLLIRGEVKTTVEELELDHIGRPAACWLGVPILAGPEPLGVIAVQSYSDSQAYDTSHLEVLVTIAAQAAVAIQNARLYGHTDEALARRVRELGSILRTTSEGVLLLDSGWRVLAANRALADLVDVAQSELNGQAVYARRPDESQPIVTLIGHTLAALGADCEALTEGEQTHRQAIVIIGPSERHVERTLTPVRDQEGGITGWLFVFRDITEEIELARLKDEFTHMLVHDLRSPLTVLNASLDLMEGAVAKLDTQNFDELMEMARRSSDRMLNMVNELLDISKLESGQLVLHPEAVSVESLLNEVLARLAPLATSAQITLEITIAPDLPQLYVDPQVIGRVTNNLLDNAIKFTPDGGQIRLWARLDPEQAPGSMLVGVTDTGPGVPPEEQPRLFEKFQQVSSVQGRSTGTGLGLPFCKLAVEAHDGKIWVESAVGKGSTFVMTLPVVE
jgi:NtrC-family two-component system sensor histidine kinase KinB